MCSFEALRMLLPNQENISLKADKATLLMNDVAYIKQLQVRHAHSLCAAHPLCVNKLLDTYAASAYTILLHWLNLAASLASEMYHVCCLL